MKGPQPKTIVSHTKGREGKTVEQIYQKKTQLEHILLRPDTYVGSVEMQAQEMWVFDSVQSRMVFRKITYVPALYKIFDEILVNAADNFQRDPVGMDTIKVEIDSAKGTVSVLNNGAGLPVVVHKEHNVYIPELVFGHLLTSDNYNDGDGKVVGGRNGYGAKLANIFSSEFIIETSDGQKTFKQRFESNMSKKNKPEVTNSKEKSFTRVTFKPDLKRLGMTCLDEDIVSLMTKRVYDIAGSTDDKCDVYFNGERLDVKNFRDYTDLYLLTRPGVPQIYARCSPRWEVCVSLNEGGFNQVSFVNSICTIRGGTHVTQVTDQVVEAVLEKAKIESKAHVKGGVDIRAHHVKNHLWVFIKCLIENPAFDSQTKETLMTKQSKFGSRCELSDEFLAQVANCGVVDLILMSALAKSKVNLAKNLKANTGKVVRLTGVPKLEDANDAGGKNSAECTLILTEGDSAKATAVAGLSVIGRDRYGVFPLRGKVLNVRDATLKQMMSNEEIQNIIKILGLDLNREYDAELKGLRYGSLMIMADQDHDGSHIKGLLINLIHAWWPTLAKMPGFLKEFFTPIVKVRKGKETISFYTMPEYEAWKEKTDNGKGWGKPKYYKGLGTSTSKEAKEYFSAIESHKLSYKYEGSADDNAIDLAFNKKRADDRKEWMNAYDEGMLVDHSQAEVTYQDFVNKELILFSRANVARAIPSLMDGFKPSQRKVLFSCFKRKLKNECKVAQLVGYVSEHSAYHHGETSLSETIVGMAQDFVGANNINLLEPRGQFGTRLQGGKDAASARYIFTCLAPAARVIFPVADDNVLEFLNEEGLSIEPTWYCPIIPMILVNGCEGIGTGWASSVPNFHPREIIANLRQLIRGKDMTEMIPWYAGFKGTLSKSEREEGKLDVAGIIQMTGENKATITELPVKRWTQDYREFLEENLPKGEKRAAGTRLLEDYAEYHTESTVHFELSLSMDAIKSTEVSMLEKAFRLRSTISMNNMVLFDAEGKIQKYDTALDILQDFAKTRLVMYEKRKAFLLGRLTRECEILTAKARFILMVVQGQIVIKRRKILDLVNDLRKSGFKPVHEMKGHGKAGVQGQDDDAAEDKDEDEEEEEREGDDEDEAAGVDGDGNSTPSSASRAATKQGIKDFEYLVGMPIATLTLEKVEELTRQRDIKKSELDTLQKKTPQKLWLDDLDQLERALDERDALAAVAKQVEEDKIMKARAKASKAKAAKGVGKGAEKRGTKRSGSLDDADASQPLAAAPPGRKRAASEDLPDRGSATARGRSRKV